MSPPTTTTTTTTTTTSPILLLLGSGPGIGLHTALAFARTPHFHTIVLVSRNATRLAKEKVLVEEASKNQTHVVTFATDLADFDQLRGMLGEVEKLGTLGCVVFNAARIQFGEVLGTGVGEVEEDFRITTLALYLTAQWCIPFLRNSGLASPSLIVTNSHLPEQPIPQLLSLSAVKASQQNVVHSLRAAFGEEVHVGVVKMSGLVREEAERLNPRAIAEEIVGFYERGREGWGSDLVLRE
ncbi:hypothetical protein M409DRAFT_26898 [Zasmidium cellare ATCC 36951]|uniref:Ketoreductase (KR) domain-containing protein n=1 Tax=Zasmidium cellare ATCC 36951 TaxID=1080233 RepID=A0A6A6C8V2_ZASCE|nr:uncharacterized protein M409DRAFT_26898 [Zasmidium cellare ATCC 36951]KAF2162660.1 hypothetical protein M409DRAFT_26898 [Zasmidium cellare ATCC 36951]